MNNITPEPTNHRKLNQLQIEILLALYKFRFATAELIGEYQNQIVRYSNARLKILLEQEYIGRNYDSSYRIKQRPATYFLLPKAIRFLKAHQNLDAKGLHLNYFSHGATAEFIIHWLRVFRIYLKLDDLFGESLEFFTSAELAEQGIYPKPRPDAYLSFSGKHSTVPHCMLDIIESTKPSDQIRRKVLRYINHNETEDTWNEDYPSILLVCDNVGLERDIQRIIARALSQHGATQPRHYTTTLRALYSAHKANEPIWTNVVETEECKALTGLQ